MTSQGLASKPTLLLVNYTREEKRGQGRYKDDLECKEIRVGTLTVGSLFGLSSVIHFYPVITKHLGFYQLTIHVS